MTVTVSATMWKFGWELEIDQSHHIQVRSLANAVREVRDYLDTIDPDVDHSGWEITVVSRVG